MISYTGKQYLAIDIANQFGLDKELFETRIAWVNDNIDNLESLVDKADDEFRYIAAVMALRDTQNNIPTGHLVGLDACASGCQIMAVLTGCLITAKNTGLTGNERMDIYQRTTEVMNSMLDIDINIPRSKVKEAQMPYFYGSSAKPKEIFGDGTIILEKFYEAQDTVAPGAVDCMNVMLTSWQPYALNHNWTMPDGFDVIVPVITNVDKKIEVDELDHAAFTYRFSVNKGAKKGLSIAANITHSVDGLIPREMARRCNYNVKQLLDVKEIIEEHLNKNTNYNVRYEHRIEYLATAYNFLSLVAVEYINRDTVSDFSANYLTDILDLINETLSRPSFELVFIHDEFKAHANYMNHVRQNYIELMAEIAESNMLEVIISYVRGKPFTYEKRSNNLGDLIRQSEYALS